MKARTIKGKSKEEIQAELIQSMEDGFEPTLGIVFISVKMDRIPILDFLIKRNIEVIGATSCGLFTEKFNDGWEGEGSVVIMLMDLNPGAYSILFEDIGNRNIEDAAEKLAREALLKFKNPAFILYSTGYSEAGNFFNGDVLIRSMEKVVGPNVKIFGGMAGDDMTLTGTYVFTGKQITDNGMAVLLMDEDKVRLDGMAISGWKALGIERTVTKSEGSWLYTIDDKPALEMYLKYLGLEPNSVEDQAKLIEDVSNYYPFQAEGIGDPVMRSPILIDKVKKAIKLDFDMPQGTKFRFSLPPDFDIVENIIESAAKLKGKVNEDAEALLIFSCVGRLSALGPLTNQENDGLSEIWNAPMTGFFTYGEYGTISNERQAFHSTTCSWVALKEK